MSERCEDCGDLVPKTTCWCQQGCRHVGKPASPMTQDKAHPTPPAVPRERTPKDYAIEHAEYMAAAGEHLIEAVNDLAKAEQERDEGTANPSDVQAAQDTLSEQLCTMRNRIYEFRKRRDRALAAPVASNTTAEPAPIQPAGVEVERDVKRAREILARLCDKGLVSMSIPVRDDDEDMVLSRIISLAASQGDRGKT